MTSRNAGPVVGVIADDLTGGSDVAVAFHRRGLRTALHFGVPPSGYAAEGCDVVVSALKIRTVPREVAEAEAVRAAERLRAMGASTLYYKYCSTFDSTPEGNIGPVLDRLVEITSARVVPSTPSSPEHGRTQYRGHLFVGDVLLSDSHMRHHPLTPMTESALPAVLQAQTSAPVGLVRLEDVQSGAQAVADKLAEMAPGHVLVDAITDQDLITIARAVHGAPLVAGAAGLAGGLAEVIAAERGSATAAPQGGRPAGPAAVLAGSCSQRTLEQIDAARRAGHPHHRVGLEMSTHPKALADSALTWFDAQPDGAAPVIYSSLPPDVLRAVQQRWGVAESAGILEQAMQVIARGLVERGIRTLVVAGGETSGAVVGALGVSGGVIGMEEAPGVPWLHTDSGLHLLLKSGNFGEPDLFITATSGRGGAR